MLSRTSPARAANTSGKPTVRIPVRGARVISRAASPDDQPNFSQGASPAVLKDIQVSCSRFMQKYEHSMLSSGVGAAAVTTWCVMHGQSPGEAAAITVVSTITALVLNELLSSDIPSL